MMTRWPEDKENTLRCLWGRCMTTNKISYQMGLSRGAVAGKLHRLGLMGDADRKERMAREAERCGG